MPITYWIQDGDGPPLPMDPMYCGEGGSVVFALTDPKEQIQPRSALYVSSTRGNGRTIRRKITIKSFDLVDGIIMTVSADIVFVTNAISNVGGSGDACAYAILYGQIYASLRFKAHGDDDVWYQAYFVTEEEGRFLFVLRGKQQVEANMTLMASTRGSGYTKIESGKREVHYMTREGEKKAVTVFDVDKNTLLSGITSVSPYMDPVAWLNMNSFHSRLDTFLCCVRSRENKFTLADMFYAEVGKLDGFGVIDFMLETNMNGWYGIVPLFVRIIKDGFDPMAPTHVPEGTEGDVDPKYYPEPYAALLGARALHICLLHKQGSSGLLAAVEALLTQSFECGLKQFLIEKNQLQHMRMHMLRLKTKQDSAIEPPPTKKPRTDIV